MCDDLVAIETLSTNAVTGHSILVSVGEAAVLVEELLALPRVSAAYQGLRDRGASSHEARASRR
jgi:hypothetical protein